MGCVVLGFIIFVIKVFSLFLFVMFLLGFVLIVLKVFIIGLEFMNFCIFLIILIIKLRFVGFEKVWKFSIGFILFWFDGFILLLFGERWRVFWFKDLSRIVLKKGLLEKGIFSKVDLLDCSCLVSVFFCCI